MISSNIKLYNFVDNHDVERIMSKLTNKANYVPVHILLYTLPGLPSVYYGSEFGIEGKKERWSDDSLRPEIHLEDHKDDIRNNPCTKLIAALGKIRRDCAHDLAWGEYKELCLMNRQFAFSRGSMIIAVNNDENDASVNVPASAASYTGLLSGRKYSAEGGRLHIALSGCGGDILVPSDTGLKAVSKAPAKKDFTPATKAEQKEEKKAVKQEAAAAHKQEKKAAKQGKKSLKKEEKKEAGSAEKKAEKKAGETKPEQVTVPDLPYEEMTVEQLQAAILAKMAKNGPVTDQMRRDVTENIWKNSLINWVKSFR
jgi:D-Tyr-tRNAtyr deacylase